MQVKCNRCQTAKPFTAEYFNIRTRNRSGLSGHCRACDLRAKKADYAANPKKYLDRMRKYAYGITPEQFDERLAAQNHVCAICLQPERRKKSTLSVDHCHKTGKIRGLLCGDCNPGLGGFKDRVALLQAAIAYLLRTSS
jgi:hypothetical protein